MSQFGSTHMTTIDTFEGAQGPVRFKRTGRLLGRFPYRLVISHPEGRRSTTLIDVSVRPFAVRRVVARRAAGEDAMLTLTVEDGRRIDLVVGYTGARSVAVTAMSDLY